MEIEEEDPILYTIPVYLNRMQDPPSCTGEMSLLQFPLRPADRPYGDEGQLVNVQLAPGEARATRLRMSYELKTNPEYYDSQSDFPVAERNLISRMVPESSVNGLAVGVIDEGELTLVPLASVNQLRPEFNYVNSDPVGVPGSLGDGVNLTSKQQHLHGIAQQLLETRGDTLPWKDADFYDEDAQETEDLFLEHIVVNSSHVRSQFPHKRTPLDLQEDILPYISTLAGIPDAVTTGAPGVPSATPSGSTTAVPTAPIPQLLKHVDLLELARMDVPKQIETVLRANTVLSHDQLLSLVHPNVKLHCDEPRLFEAMSQAAFLVRGYWVVKSQFTAVKASLWNARDIILLACSKGADLNEHFLGKYLGGASDLEIDEILRPLCAPDSARKIWKWRHGLEGSFGERFGEEASRQSKVLDDHIRAAMNVGAGGVTANGAPAGNVSTQLSHADKTVRDLLMNQAASFDEVKKTLQSVIRNKEVNDQSVLESLGRLSVTELRPRWFCLNVGSLGDSQLDKYREIIMAIYKVQDKVNKMQILEQIKASSGRDCQLTDHDLRKLIKEFARLERGYWVFRGAVKQEE